MTDTTLLHQTIPAATLARRPLLGMSILVVEDSRFCSEAIRLMARKSGARVRRADSIASAHKHLGAFRPNVAVVDVGLPDGDGLEVVRELATLAENAPVLIATSGLDPETTAQKSLEAGADAFMPKPVPSITAFQELIVRFFPDRREAELIEQSIAPVDEEFFLDDLDHVSEILSNGLDRQDPNVLTYCGRFLLGLAETAQDEDLLDAAMSMVSRLSSGGTGARSGHDALSLIEKRLGRSA